MSIWTTRKGEVVPMSELSDAHLLNIKAMLERQAEQIQVMTEHDVYLEMAGDMPSGDIAQYAVEQELDALLQCDPISFIRRYYRPYKEIVQEIAQRST